MYQESAVKDLKLPELPADLGCNLPVRMNTQFQFVIHPEPFTAFLSL